MRIFATIAVVWHHTCGTLVDNAELFYLTRQQNIFFEAARQSVSWDVPVFVMITLLIIDFVLPLISKLSGVDIAINIPLTYPCLYMLLGYFSCNCLLQLSRYRKPIVSGVVAIFLLSWILNYATSIDTKPLFAYNSPIIAVYAVGVYVLFGTSNWIMSNRLWSIDRLCFSVYIIHVLFIQFCYRVLNILPTHSLYPVMTLAFGIVFVVVSFLVAWMLYKIKPLRKYVL